MHTFAQKPKATQQTTTAKSTITERTQFGQSREVNSILQLQRTIGNQAVQRLLEANMRDVRGNSITEIARFGHDFSRIPVHAPTSAIEVTSKEIPNPSNIELYGELSAYQGHAATKAPPPVAARPFFDFARIPINVPSETGQEDAYLWRADGAETSLKQYRQQQGQCPPAASSAGSLNGPAVAFGHTFNILWSNASVSGSFRPPTTTRPGVIDQFGPSFSMGGRVEAPAAVTDFRLGIIQEAIQSLRCAHYSSLSTGAPWMICEYTAGSGLDLHPGSTSPWYNSSRTRQIAPIAVTGMADDPHGEFLLVVNNQGTMGGSVPEGKLEQLSGCDRFRTWLVIEAPTGGLRAIAWAAWVANWNIAYRTVFTALSAGPPTTTATPLGSTGWMISAPQIGTGPPIPSSAAPPFVKNCILLGSQPPRAPQRSPRPTPPAASR